MVTKKELFESVEKRVRKDLRINKKIGKTIELLDDGSKEFKVAMIMLQNIFGTNILIKKVKTKSKNAFIATNLDKENKQNLETYFKNKITKPRLTLLDNILEEEIIAICEFKGIKSEKEIEDIFVEPIAKKHSEIKFSIAKSFHKIRELTVQNKK